VNSCVPLRNSVEAIGRGMFARATDIQKELRRDARVFTVVALMIAVMLTISTCHHHRSLDSTIGLKITSLDLSTAESIDSAENPPNLTSWKNSMILSPMVESKERW